jgi:hypothetical protein
MIKGLVVTALLLGNVAFAQVHSRNDAELFNVRWDRDVSEIESSYDWSDANAPSLETLRRGSIIEVTQEFTVRAGRNYIVEQNGLLESEQFAKIPQYRFANVWLINQNDGTFLRPTTYPSGLKMKVLNVIPHRSASLNAWTEYEIQLKTIQAEEWPFQIVDPIVHMTVTGRREGRADVKLPQFVEMMKPYMKVTPL